LQIEIIERLKKYPYKNESSILMMDPLNSPLSAGLNDSPLISFGSGPDIFTAMALSPRAKEYHLVDILTGWGSGPRDILSTLHRRLKWLAEGGEVTVVQSGFTSLTGEKVPSAPALFSASYWTGWGYPNPETFRPEFVAPLILKVKWTSAALGPQERTVFVHPIDFDHPPHVEVMREHIQSPLGTIVVTGMTPPNNFAEYIQHLRPGGRVVLELYNPETEESKKLFSLLKENGSVEAMPPSVYTPEPLRTQLLLFIRKN